MPVRRKAATVRGIQMSAKQTVLFTIAASVLLQATPAATQEVRVAGTGPAALEEIVVTARKREESFLDVPVIATVLTQDTLERTKTDDLYALAAKVPSLLLGNAVNSTGTQVSLRGIGTTALNATMDQSVSLNIDGLTLTQGVAYGIGMFDVAQVEVLKGPQSLFFGKNNTAGVISLRSVDPTDEFEMIARAGYEAEAEEKQVDLILSGPVTDSLKLRLATRYSDQEGFFTNDAVATPGLGGVTPKFRNYAPADNLMIRGTALYEPSDEFTARLKLGYGDIPHGRRRLTPSGGLVSGRHGPRRSGCEYLVHRRRRLQDGQFRQACLGGSGRVPGRRAERRRPVRGHVSSPRIV